METTLYTRFVHQNGSTCHFNRANSKLGCIKQNIDWNSSSWELLVKCKRKHMLQILFELYWEIKMSITAFFLVLQRNIVNGDANWVFCQSQWTFSYQANWFPRSWIGWNQPSHHLIGSAHPSSTSQRLPLHLPKVQSFASNVSQGTLQRAKQHGSVC